MQFVKPLAIHIRPLFLGVAALAALSGTSQAQQAQQPQADQQIQPAAQTGQGHWWQPYEDRLLNIYDNGQDNLLLSGYAHHGRNTYTAERLRELNEKAWGLGFSRSLRDAKDNEEIVYALAISDSHFKPEVQVGYAYEWMKPLGGDWEAGVGYTAMLMSRQDYFKGFPFPVALPVASIGTRHTKLMASYVPRLSQNKGNGDVLLMFMKFDIK
jgi:palmitoyl transferase